MAGFFGLFGNKTKYVDEPMDMSAPEPKEAFYLEPDDSPITVLWQNRPLPRLIVRLTVLMITFVALTMTVSILS